MTKPSPAQVIQPPNTLKLKVGAGGFGGIDLAAVAKAEEALRGLSAQFGEWLQDELNKMDAARDAIRTAGYTPATSEQLYMRAHDLKGLGGTYQYPLVTRMAASLCRITDTAERRADAPLFLIDAHIDAIKAVVRDGIQTDDHPVGRALAEELERQVAQHMGG
ncbi:Hpt domain-containing protein [Brevundimonas sp. 2R-24]|uniref:Hpt domain-containing protein n=1 Tax=Peiella sedimenti TaxID=3061083 RepID=A0ABT8SMT5_9CAUL|nr:Hpt domain-containing protein [Caulobacteraceae bacterium XZ-24]